MPADLTKIKVAAQSTRSPRDRVLVLVTAATGGRLTVDQLRVLTLSGARKALSSRYSRPLAGAALRLLDKLAAGGHPEDGLLFPSAKRDPVTGRPRPLGRQAVQRLIADALRHAEPTSSTTPEAEHGVKRLQELAGGRDARNKRYR